MPGSAAFFLRMGQEGVQHRRLEMPTELSRVHVALRSDITNVASLSEVKRLSQRLLYWRGRSLPVVLPPAKCLARIPLQGPQLKRYRTTVLMSIIYKGHARSTAYRNAPVEDVGVRVSQGRNELTRGGDDDRGILVMFVLGCSGLQIIGIVEGRV